MMGLVAILCVAGLLLLLCAVPGVLFYVCAARQWREGDRRRP